MKHKDWHVMDFFRADGGGLSMTRLLCFMSFFPASYVVIKVQDEGTLGWYLGAYVLGYVGGKGADAIMSVKGKRNVGDRNRVSEE